jgi:hypothetical protein
MDGRQRQPPHFSEEVACRSFLSPRLTASLYDAAPRPAPQAALPESAPPSAHRGNRPRSTLAKYIPPLPSRRRRGVPDTELIIAYQTRSDPRLKAW